MFSRLHSYFELVILSAAKNLPVSSNLYRILLFAQNDTSFRFSAFPIVFRQRRAQSQRVKVREEDSVTLVLHQLRAQRSGSELERKTETADTEFFRHLRKPGKRSGAGFV